MTKRIFSKVVWFGRATTFMVGLAVILALTVGLASTALAGTGVGSAFNLGKTNTVSAISKLVGSVAGPSLLIDNNSTNSAATALDLQVEAGKAPMKVNSGAKVANLNADKLDGMDAGQLQGFSTLRVSTTDVNTTAGGQRLWDRQLPGRRAGHKRSRPDANWRLHQNLLRRAGWHTGR